MITIERAKQLPEMLLLKKFAENSLGHKRQNVYVHSLKVLRKMRLLTRDRFMHLVALLHDIGKPQTLVKKKGVTSCPGHDEAGAEIISRLDLGLAQKRHANAVMLVRNHLIAFRSPNFAREIGRKSKGFAREQMLLAIADLQGGDEWILSRKSFLQKLKLFKRALREAS